MQPTRTILWDIYEEHLDEAAFLFGQWESALDAANYTLDEVASGPEERLLAHLDGLVLGGRPVAEKLLVPALAEDDTAKITAAAWALLEGEDADHFDAIAKAFQAAEPGPKHAIGRALELGNRPDLTKRLIALDDANDPALSAMILDIASSRDLPWATSQLDRAFNARHPSLLAAALRTARRAPNPAYAGYVEHAFASDSEDVRREAIATGFIMGLPGVGPACQREAQAAGPACRLPLALLARMPESGDFVRSRLAVPEAQRHALWALGFGGDPAAIDALLAALGDEKTARVAGESLSLITGLTIAGPLATPGKTQGPSDIPEVADDDPPPEVRPEDHLPIPRTAALQAWWKKSRDKFTDGVRHFQGQPHALPVVRAVFDRVPMWRREVFALEIAATSRAPVHVDLRTWTRRQRAVLAAR